MVVFVTELHHRRSYIPIVVAVAFRCFCSCRGGSFHGIALVMALHFVSSMLDP